jgi:surface antigen
VNPLITFGAFNFARKNYLIVFAVALVIVALPFMALLKILGSDTASYLSNSSSSVSNGLYEGPPVPGDTYAWGNCTYWAFAMRLQAGNPIPTTWGNANTWAIDALADGYVVDHTPTVGAVMATTAGDLGHVAYVTAVDSVTGAWTISEMNAPHLDVVDARTLPASQDLLYYFIHDKVKL